MPPHRIESRWCDIPEDQIYTQLVRLGITAWGEFRYDIGTYPRHYLYGGGYAYPYSLPVEVVRRLANRLNQGRDMTWYMNYNQQAIDYFDKNGAALNQAAAYWEQVGNEALPKPEILPIDGLSEGAEYIAIIGLFHLAAEENQGNSHLFIDLIDEVGNRIYNHTPPLDLYYGWEGITPDQETTTAPVRIDKPLNEPGANIGITWGQVIYGFHINNIACDRFRGIHIRYPNDGAGNSQGHHSHYIVLQKRRYKPPEGLPEPVPAPTPEPDPIPEPEPPDEPPVVKRPVFLIDKAWVTGQPENDDGYVEVYGDD